MRLYTCLHPKCGMYDWACDGSSHKRYTQEELAAFANVEPKKPSRFEAPTYDGLHTNV
jgi:hypothetical protein